jgi:hypothetical protein
LSDCWHLSSSASGILIRARGAEYSLFFIK